MDDTVPERIRPALAAIVERLAAGDYDGLKRDGIDPHSDADLSLWIREYGATLTPLPDDAWAESDAMPLGPSGWSVVVPLWTEEEGRGDLSLEATVHEAPDGPKITIDNIRVL